MTSLRRGDAGDAVGDLQKRLALAGYDVAEDHYVFGAGTEDALRRFQIDRKLIADGICGPQSWNALVEADYQLGDRLLYYKRPMMRGDDVGDLQQQLSKLGFDTGWIDGIFGLDTQSAVQRFQLNVELTADGVVGRSTLEALHRLSRRSAGELTVTEVREHERLRQQPRLVEGRRIVLGDTGELPVVTRSVARQLRRAGAEVLSFSTPDLTHQARVSNDWGGDVYLGVALTSNRYGVSYFATTGFKSTGGQALADRCADGLQSVFAESVQTAGMKLPILRETRMPAVWCRLGPGSLVVTRSPEISAALAKAVIDWCYEPLRR